MRLDRQNNKQSLRLPVVMGTINNLQLPLLHKGEGWGEVGQHTTNRESAPSLLVEGLVLSKAKG